MTQWNIEVSENMYDVISDLFSVTGMSPPSEITSKEMQKVLYKMRNYLNPSRSKNTINPIESLHHTIPDMDSVNTALIISEAGISRYQISNMLMNNNINVKSVENLYNGLAEYIKRLPGLVIIDVRDKQEDITAIIDEIKRIAIRNCVQTSVVVLSPECDLPSKQNYVKIHSRQFIENVGKKCKKPISGFKSRRMIPA